MSAASRVDGWVPQVVSPPYLHALPLVDGLAGDSRLRLHRGAPSRLAAMLQCGRIDAGLLPVIDLQRMSSPPLVIPVGCVGCDGPTEIVRVFSRKPPATLRRLAVDPASHTAVTLARVLWAETFGRRLEMVPLRPGIPSSPSPADAVLVVGDKAASWPAKDYLWRMDLGAAWRELTGLPFVFAIWAMRSDVDRTVRGRAAKAAYLATLLREARVRGMGRIEEIALRHAAAFGWEPGRAARQLAKATRYKFAPDLRQGMEAFFHMAARHRFIDGVRPVVWADIDLAASADK